MKQTPGGVTTTFSFSDSRITTEKQESTVTAHYVIESSTDSSSNAYNYSGIN